jgi:pSer/pThr/pTyr-binding forkhead associated (FHA) protein
MSKVCSACFHDNPDSVVFCEVCGIELSLPENSTSETPEKEQENYQPPSSLLTKQPNAPIAEFTLEGTSLLIGRFDPDLGPVEIDLEGFIGDETISRNHAEIYLENGFWKIKDLGSINGVFIKKSGQTRFSPRISEPTILEIGDELSIAKIRFLVQ